MARTIAEIEQLLISSIQSYPELALATSTSNRALWRLWAYIVATAQATEEQLSDAFLAQVEGQVAIAAPGSAQWLQNKVLQFQYSETVPQIVQLNTSTFAPEYPVVNTSYQIISRCSIIPGILNSVLVKVAAGSPPHALTGDQVDALRSYVNYIGVAGINYQVTSNDPDLFSIEVDVYYEGQYAPMIKTLVTNGVNAYLSSVPFNGKIKLSDLEIALRGITGINDIVFKNISAHASNAAPTHLVTNYQILSPTWQTQAGYIILEGANNTPFMTSPNSINLTAQ